MRWFLGQPNGALNCINRAEELSGEIGHVQSREHALNAAAHCYLFGARYQEALHAISASLALANQYGFEMRIAMGRIIEFGANAKLSETAPQPAVMARLIDQYEATGARGFGTYYNLLYAEAMLAAGDFDEAIAKIDDTFALGIELGEHWWDAELHRLKGIAISHHKDGDLDTAITCMGKANDTARSQGALMLQLRALCSLVELKQLRDVQAEVEELQLVYDRCQRDPAWPDIATAGRLLSKYKP